MPYADIRIDSSDKYVQLLHHFCASIQGLEEHLYNFTGPCAPSYHYLDQRTRSAIEARVLKAAEFASAVVVPFVLDDFKQFFVCPSSLSFFSLFPFFPPHLFLHPLFILLISLIFLEQVYGPL